ncbi:MAG: YceI family protein [Saprospiraceae bacterium]|nr:YceI family protein [Saprospiraceae bacterium]MCB9320999.1 YceI family protein [Lewinellaceae bacterium]
MTTEKTVWKLDPAHSEITFKVKHMMISNVKGAFNMFQAEIQGEDFTKSKITVDINAASIDTNSPDRDAHLKSADFFDTENYPTLHFESTSFTKVKGDEYELKGFLTMKGVRNEVTLEVEFGGINKDPWGHEKAGFSVEGKINRKDWGLNWNAALETGGVLVSDEVRLQADIQFVKQTV